MQATLKPTAFKALAVPNEHGAWGFWLEASLLGLMVAPSPAGVWLALTALSVIFVCHPLKLALADWTRGKRYPRTRHAFLMANAYALVTFSAALLAHLSAERAFWLPLLVAAPLGLVQLERDVHNKGRDLSAELGGALAFAALTSSIALAGGANLERFSEVSARFCEAPPVRAYSTDLRERVVKAVQNGLSKAEAARRFSLSLRTIKNWHQQQPTTGTLEPKPRHGRPRTIPASEQAALHAQLEAHTDATLKDHCQLWTKSDQRPDQRPDHAPRHRAPALIDPKRPCTPASATRPSARRGTAPAQTCQQGRVGR